MSRDLIFIAIALFTWGLGESAFFAFQPLYLEQLGADPIQIGAILGAYGLAAAVAHIPAGYLADRFGRRPLILAAWVQGAAAVWLLALARALPLFVVGMLVYGMTAYVSAPLASYVTAARGNWSVGRALTLSTASYNSGAILGPVIGGFIGLRLGYQPIFIYAAVLFAISTAVVLLIRSQPIEAHTAGHSSISLLANRRYMVFLGVYFLAVFAMYLPQPLSPNFLQNQRHLSLLEIGQLTSISSIGIVVLALFMGRLEARKGYLLGQGLVAVFALLMWKASGMVWFGVGFFLMGGFRASRSLATAHIRSLVNSSTMGLAYGLAETTSTLALVLAPALAGYLYDRNPEWMYIAGASLIAVSLLVNGLVNAPKPAVRIVENISS